MNHFNMKIIIYTNITLNAKEKNFTQQIHLYYFYIIKQKHGAHSQRYGYREMLCCSVNAWLGKENNG